MTGTCCVSGVIYTRKLQLLFASSSSIKDVKLVLDSASSVSNCNDRYPPGRSTYSRETIGEGC